MTIQPRDQLAQVSGSLASHYSGTVKAHGCTAQGVDWGPHPERVQLRYDLMLAQVSFPREQPPRILDVGCGFGGLLQFCMNRDLDVVYTGIDISHEMILRARSVHPEATFVEADALTWSSQESFDYVFCNGLFTQKLNMDENVVSEYARETLLNLWKFVDTALIFNLTTQVVNYQEGHLLYSDAGAWLNWALRNLTRHVTLNHSYGLYEFFLNCFTSPNVGLPLNVSKAE